VKLKSGRKNEAGRLEPRLDKWRTTNLGKKTQLGTLGAGKTGFLAVALHS
jgi:hypothetical protein